MINDYKFYILIKVIKLGDWGLGIGDCPIPNPQSPIPKFEVEIANIQ